MLSTMSWYPFFMFEIAILKLILLCIDGYFKHVSFCLHMLLVVLGCLFVFNTFQSKTFVNWWPLLRLSVQSNSVMGSTSNAYVAQFNRLKRHTQTIFSFYSLPLIAFSINMQVLLNKMKGNIFYSQVRAEHRLALAQTN